MKSKLQIYFELACLFIVSFVYTVYFWFINTTQPLDLRSLPWMVAVTLAGFHAQKHVRHNPLFKPSERIVILVFSSILGGFFLFTIAIYYGTMHM